MVYLKMSIIFTNLILLLNLMANTAAQCTIQHFQVTPHSSSPSSQLSVSWECDAGNNVFAISYQLTNKDQCDTGDGSLQPPFNVITVGWRDWNNRETGGMMGNPYMYSTSLLDLLPYSTYFVSIQSRRGTVDGPTRSTSVTTGEAVPSGMPTASFEGSSETNVSFSWIKLRCGSRHGNITGYEYHILESSSQQPATKASFIPMMIGGQLGLRVTGLSCDTKYTFHVAGKNNAGPGPNSSVVCSTENVKPDSVQNIQTSISTATRITVTWSEPLERGCPVVDTYKVSCLGNTRHNDECHDLLDPHTVLDTSTSMSYACVVKPFYSYNITVKAIGGTATSFTTELSLELAPSVPPGNVREAGSLNTNPTITWDEIPCSKRNGIILGYRYELSVLRSTGYKVIALDEVTTTSVSITLETPGMHIFSVAGRTVSGTGPYANISIDTTTSIQTTSLTTTNRVNVVTTGSASAIVSNYSSNTTISLTTSSPDEARTTTTTNENGVSGTSGGDANTVIIAAASGVIVVVLILIILIVLLVVIRKRKRKSTRSVSDTLLLETMDPIKPKGEKAYADNEGFQNGYGGLYPDLSHLDGNPSAKPRKQLPTELSIEPSVVPRKHDILTENARCQQEPAGIENVMEDNASGMPPERPPKPQAKSRKAKPVRVENLPEFIAKQKENYSEGFAKAFDDIPIGREYSWDESLKEANKSKSRYQNIYPYDHSRILLEIMEGIPNSDYINASLVKGYKDKPYIAAQGPSKGSMGDIWRMAWEQKSTKIVMLTNLVEQGKRKCEQYWPDTKEPFVCTPMTVRRKKIARYADFVIRDFVLEKDGEKEPYEVRQFHFVSWPDMGVPEYPTQLLNFLRLVNAYEPEESGLPILHCSAGVGRTGTFITIAGMLEMAASEGKIDVDGAIRKLRKDRISMVQTREQYEFIFDTVQEALTSGDTGILITNLRQRFNDLQNTVNKKTGKTTLEEQFKILEDLTVVPTKSDSMSGNAPENADKNRFPDREPPNDGRRPYLGAPLLNGGTDYINAAFIDGYVRKKEFISTQMPLTNTIEDFWTMVYEFKSTSIVMLNRMSQSDPSFGMYWVESGTKQMNNFTVEFQSKRNYMDEVIGRTFKVYPNENPQDCLFVQQFQLHNWPLGQDTPDSVLPLITMINAMEKWQKEQPKAVRGTPIVVHCIDGIEASGVFCALVIMLNKMKAEKIVDVFQSVKRVRMSRPGIVQTLDQYTFLYEAAQVSLDEFKTYENFR